MAPHPGAASWVETGTTEADEHGTPHPIAEVATDVSDKLTEVVAAGGIIRWDLTNAVPDGRTAEREWRPWPAARGGGVAMVSLEPSIRRAVQPHLVSFTGQGRSTAAHSLFEAPFFLPVGWSPSGKYFAVVPLAEAGQDMLGDRDLVVISAKDGSEAARVPLERSDPERWPDTSGAPAVWDARSDRFYFAQGRPSDRLGEDKVLAYAQVGGTSGEVTGSEGETPWAAGEDWYLAGADASGPAIVEEADGEGGGATLWRVAGGRFTRERTLAMPGMVIDVALAPDGALLALVDDPDHHYRLIVFTPGSWKPRTLWESTPGPQGPAEEGQSDA
jgi:hypothetical protein